jgi:hypothetical protein
VTLSKNNILGGIGGAMDVEAPIPAAIPLRFWIALTLSATVVVFLALMGSVYGVFLTDSLRSWATETSKEVVEARAFLLLLPDGENRTCVLCLCIHIRLKFTRNVPENKPHMVPIMICLHLYYNTTQLPRVLAYFSRVLAGNRCRR